MATVSRFFFAFLALFHIMSNVLAEEAAEDSSSHQTVSNLRGSAGQATIVNNNSTTTTTKQVVVVHQEDRRMRRNNPPVLEPEEEEEEENENAADSNCQTRTSVPLGSSNQRTVGRIGRFFYPSTCLHAREYPGVVGHEERYYEQVGPFTHPAGEQGCVSVHVDAGSCTFQGHTLVIAAAYTSFHPSFMSSGYLGGVGNPSSSKSFSFHLPELTSFYVVGHQILPNDYHIPPGYTGNAPNGNGCEFSVQVEFGPQGNNDNACTINNGGDPQSNVPSLPASHLDECTVYESVPMGSSGRTVKGWMYDFDNSDCLELNLFPGTSGRSGQPFEQIGPFVNPTTDATQCVEVSIDYGSCVDQRSGEKLVHVSAYLDEFDPSNQRNNYVGGIGDPQVHSSFHFQLAPEGFFYVVGRQVVGGNSHGCQFSITTVMTDGC